MRYLLILILLLPSSLIAQDLNRQWQSIDSLINAGDFNSASGAFPSFLEILEKEGMNDKLVTGYYHYGNTLIKTGELLRADWAYNKAKEKAKLEGLDENYRELTQVQIVNIFNAVRGNTNIPAGNLNILLQNIYSYSLDIEDLSLQKKIQLFRIDIERKNNRLSSALELAEKLRTDLQSKTPDDPDIPKLNLLAAELSLKTGKKSSEVTENLTPDQSAQILIFSAIEAEKSGSIQKAYEILAELKPEQYSTLRWELISDIVKKRFELADKLDRVNEVISDLDLIRSELISDESKLNIGMLEILKLIIISNLQSGNIQKAYSEITYIEKALADKRVSDDFYPHFFRMRGDISYLQADYEDAITYYNKALENITVFSRREYFSLINNLGLAYFKDKNRAASIASFDKLISEAADPQFIRFAVQADLNAGVVYLKDELLTEALERFKRAQERAQKSDILELNLIASIRMAEVYYNQGFNDFASQKFREVKTLVTQVKNPQDKINILSAIGLYERNRKNPEQAVIYFNQAYALANQFNLIALKVALAEELGDTYLISGKAAEAKNLYNSILPYIQASNDLSEIVTLNIKISKAHYVLSEYNKAVDYLNNNISLLGGTTENYLKVKGSELKDIYLYILTLTELASSNFSAGLMKHDTRLVFQSYREAQAATGLSNEYFITQLISAKDNDNSMKYLETYRLMVDIAVNLYFQTGDLKYLNESFETSEQSRSRNFITEVGSSLIEKLNDKDLSKVSGLSRQIEEKRPFSRALLTVNGSNNTAAGQKRGIKVIKDTTKSIIKLQSKYDEILNELKKNKNKAAELVSISTLTVPAVQQLMEVDQVILNYFVSKESIYLYCIRKDTVSLSIIDIPEEKLREYVQEIRTNIQNPQSDEYRTASSLLYTKLINPVRGHILGKKLILIPSGQLNNLPFSALYTEGKFLVEDHIITVLPNLSSLQLFRKKSGITPSSPLVAIGNPLNDYTSPLPGAESEVKAIQSIFKNNNSYFRESAQESIIKKEISKGELVHIACHGLFNYDYPLLSCLALAGNEKDDGRLELHEIYNLNLNKTSLVVLSACETALSQIKENDDMIGLVRGFLYTGASSVIASLWKVDDAGTYELMVKFYNYLAQGNSKGLSLQKAQIDMIKSSNFAHPFYWSAFMLNGME